MARSLAFLVVAGIVGSIMLVDKEAELAGATAPRSYPGPSVSMLFLPAVMVNVGSIATSTATPTMQSVNTPVPTTTPTPPASTPTSTPTPTRTPSATSTSTSTPPPSYTPPPTTTPVPTATTTPVPPTPTPLACDKVENEIQNGSFEDGWTGWSSTGTVYRSSYFSSAGSWSLLLGNSNSADDVASQTINVPTWAETAAVYYKVLTGSDDSTVLIRDVLRVSIWDTGTNTKIQDTYLDNTETRLIWSSWRWTMPSATSYRNRTLKLEFEGVTDSILPTSWNIDEVYFQFGCGNHIAGADTN